MNNDGFLGFQISLFRFVLFYFILSKMSTIITHEIMCKLLTLRKKTFIFQIRIFFFSLAKCMQQFHRNFNNCLNNLPVTEKAFLLAISCWQHCLDWNGLAARNVCGTANVGHHCPLRRRSEAAYMAGFNWKRSRTQSSHPMQCACTCTCTCVGAHAGWPSECSAEERYNNNIATRHSIEFNS